MVEQLRARCGALTLCRCCYTQWRTLLYLSRAVRRQALWFAQRAAEQEKDSVLQQLQSTGLRREKHQPCPE